MGMRLANGNWSDALADTPENQAKYGEGSGYTGGYGYSGPTAGPAPTTVNANNADVQKLGSQINSLMSAIASGNKEAFDEAVRQFNLSFGLDQSKFQEAVRQFNQNYLISEAGLTGTYQGQPTQQRLLQEANIAAQKAGLTGLYGETPTLALQELYGAYGTPKAGQQTLAAQQQGYAQQTGLVQLAAAQQANPFRQAQVIGQLGNLLRGGAVAGFQAPGQAQGQTDFTGMGNLQRMIDDIRGGPGAINSQSVQGVLDAIPTPNKVNSVDFYKSSPLTQNLVLQGMREKYGLSPDDALAQIRNTLPQFQSPTTFGGVKR